MRGVGLCEGHVGVGLWEVCMEEEGKVCSEWQSGVGEGGGGIGMSDETA